MRRGRFIRRYGALLRPIWTVLFIFLAYIYTSYQSHGRANNIGISLAISHFRCAVTSDVQAAWRSWDPILGYRFHLGDLQSSGRSPSRHNLVVFLLMATDYARAHRVTRSFDVDKQSGSPLVHKTYHSKAYSLCGFENPYPKIPLSIFGGRTEDVL